MFHVVCSLFTFYIVGRTHAWFGIVEYKIPILEIGTLNYNNY